jgi:hypothetical protein
MVSYSKRDDFDGAEGDDGKKWNNITVGNIIS